MIDLIDLAGLIAAAILLVTLIALDIRRAGADTGPPPRPRFLGRTLHRGAVVLMGTLYVLLFLPRVLGLLA